MSNPKRTNSTPGGRSGSWGTWTLIETLDPTAQPTALAIGPKTKEWVSAERAIGSRALSVIANITDGNQVVVYDDARDSKTIIAPIAGPEGDPHGHRVWIGPANTDPGTAPPAAGFIWDANNHGAYETFECAAMSGTSAEQFQAFRPVSDFTRRAVRFDSAIELAEFAYTLKPGSRFISTVSVQHIVTGAIMPWIIALRDNGANNNRANGLFYDMTPVGAAPLLPTAEELGLREFSEQADRYIALVNLLTSGRPKPEMVLASWITNPPPWVRHDGGSGETYIHPDDRETFARTWAMQAIAHAAATGPNKGPAPRFTIRLAGWEPGEWIDTSAVLRPYARGDAGVVDNLYVMEVTRT